MAICLFVTACSSKEENMQNDEKQTAGAHYQTAAIEKGGIAVTIQLPAQLAAYQEVSIFPKVNGYIKNVPVDIGSHVSQGQLLMTLEAPELVQASLQAKEKFAKAKSDYAISRESYLRLLQASKTPGAVSPLDISTLKSRMDADSSLSNAAMANWQMEQEMLGYLKVIAPFDGVITERNVHPGALVSNTAKDRPMLELKQNNRLRLQVDVPANIAASLKEKDSLTFYVNALNGKKMFALVSRKSSDVNMQYRTERIEADVMNANNELASGMYVEVMLTSKGNADGFIVPRSAVVTSTEKKYVIAVRNNKAVKINVETGNEDSGRIEVNGSLLPNDIIIVNANDEIKEGTEVK